MALFWREIGLIVILAIVIISPEVDGKDNTTTAGPPTTTSTTTILTTDALSPTTTMKTTPRIPTTGAVTTAIAETTMPNTTMPNTTMPNTTMPEIVTTNIMTTVMPNGEWTVVDSDGKDCMKMQLDGIFKVGMVEINIPPDAISNASKCMEDVAVFNLQMTEDNASFNMTLRFEITGNTYNLTKISFALCIDSATYYGELNADIWEAPVGQYYSCDESWTKELATVSIGLNLRKLQPFVKKTDKQDYGDVFHCGDPLPAKPVPNKRIGLIVTMTLLGVLVIAIAMFFVFKKRSTYKRFQNSSGI